MATPVSSQTQVARFCRWARHYSIADGKEDPTAARVRYLLLDHLANALGGLTAPSSQVVRQLCRGRAGPCPALGGDRLPEEYAALIAGASAHALESDDTHQPSSSHPGSVIFPAALALAAVEKTDFIEFVNAVVVGYELMARVGMAATPTALYRRGFHPTGTCGVFGAALAAGRLLGLEERELVSAIGIAASFASGSMEFLADGAWTKRLHPGWAAHSGLIAARLARLGYVGASDGLAGKFGFLHAYSDGADATALEDGLGVEPLAVHRTSVKAHACCRYMQAPIDAVLEIVRGNDIEPDSIEAIRLGVLAAAWDIIVEPAEQKRRLRSVVDAQFSMPYGAAVAALYRSAGVTEFRPAVIESSAVAEMMARVQCYRSPELDAQYPQRWPAEATVVLKDGRAFHKRVDYPKGDPENPLSWSEMEGKFLSLSAGVLEEEAQEAIIAAVRDLGERTFPGDIVRLVGSKEILKDGS